VPKLIKFLLIALLFSSFSTGLSSDEPLDLPVMEYSAETIRLTEQTSLIELNHPIETLITTQKSPNPLINLLHSNEFSTKQFSKSLKPGQHISWHRLKLKGELKEASEKRFVLSMENAIIDYLDVYLINKQGQIIKQQSFGSNDIYSASKNRGIKFFHFTIKAQQTLTILIRKQSVSPPILLLNIYDDESAKTAEQNQLLFWGGVIALLFGIGLYNILIYWISKNKASFWYIVFYLTSFVYFSGLHGFGVLYWSDSFQRLLASNMMTFNFLLIWLLLRFSVSFLKAKVHAPNYFRRLMFFEPIILVGLFVSIWVVEYKMIPIFVVIQAVTSVIVISMAISIYRNGFYPARFFLMSWTCIVIGAGVGMATFTGFVPVNFYTMHAFFFGSLCELLLMSVALADQLRYAEKRAIAQAFTDPRTKQPNFSFFKSDLFHLPKKQLVDNNNGLYFLLIQVDGVRDILGLMGPQKMEAVYQAYTKKFEVYLKKCKWTVSFEVSPGERRYMISLPGNHILIVANCDQNLSEIVESIISLSENRLKLGELESRFALRVGVAKISETRASSKVESQEAIYEAYRQAQLALLNCDQNNLEWCRFSVEHDETIREQLKLLNELREAIQNASFDIYIQPQFSISNRELIGGEVLIRWNHLRRGFIPPSMFIPLAERTSNIYPITKIVIEKSFKWLASSRELLSKRAKKFRLSINLSVQDIYRPELIPFIKERLMYYSLEPSQVMFEITESAIIEDYGAFQEQIKKIRELGYSVALDDFGTGYSSMSYLQKIDLNEIKIDLSFVRDIEQSPVNQKIVAAIIQLSQSIGAITVAEGIETEEELSILKELGANLVQGYLTGKPMETSTFVEKYMR
jgi:diguanylate cyclase